MIIHLGRDIHWGHYISLIMHDCIWYKYNDNEVSVFDEKKLHTIFGGINDHGAAAYIVFYEKVNKNRELNLQVIEQYIKESSTISPFKQASVKKPESIVK